MRLRELVGVLGLATAVTSGAIGCHTSTRQPDTASRAPRELLGTYEDDYGSTHRISPTQWDQDASARYDIREWHADSLYVIAQNAVSNPTDGGLWTRIDWLRLDGAPYEWAYCLSAYQAPSAAAARATSVAHRGTPKTGCNGYPFTRLKRVSGR